MAEGETRPALMRRLAQLPGRLWRAVGPVRVIALGLLALLVMARASDPLPLEILRARTFDLYQVIQPRPVPEQLPITIIDMDEESLARLGQWPWPRTLLADLVKRLNGMGAAAIAFDVVFAEPDRVSADRVAETLPLASPALRERLKELPSNDTVFAESMQGRRVVLGQGLLNTPTPPDEASRIPFVEIGGDPRPYLAPFPGLRANLPMLEKAAAMTGVYTVATEVDRVVRRVPAVVQVAGQLRPSLALATLAAATGNTTFGIRTQPGAGIEGVIVRPNLVETDPNGRIRVYFSKSSPRRYVSAYEVFETPQAVAPRIAGRLVLFGTSAVGLNDLRTTPVERSMAGVEVHAQILENILFQTQLRRPVWALGLELVSTVAMGVLLIILVPMVGARWTLALFLLFGGSAIAGSWFAFSEHRVLLSPAFAVITTLVIYIIMSYGSFAREEARRRQVRDAFSRYMSPALVEQLAADPSRLKLGGERRDMTILFCDVRGFTSISERYDAEGLTRLINRFLTPMTDVILRYQGTIDKYMGDCIMAFWNAPLPDSEHSRHACSAALAMLEAMEQVNVDLKAEAEAEGTTYLPLKVGIGLNSGEVCVGNMGSDQRFDYSVLGDNVNLASRLEGQSKPYGVQVVIGENMVEAVADYALLELDLIRVKGKLKPVRIHTLLGEPELHNDPDFAPLKERHETMLAAYRAQDWDAMAQALQACRAGLGEKFAHLDSLYNLYQERLDTYRATPPGPEWDGVFVATSK